MDRVIHGEEKIQESADMALAAIIEDSEDLIGEISEVMIVVNVHWGSSDDGESDTSTTFYRCSSGFRYVQLGMVEEVRRAIDYNTTHPDE